MSMEQNREPTVSIIVPVYNAKKVLWRCLDSIYAQTYGSWEAILVDDGSQDGSAEICDDAPNKDPRFRRIHKANGGVSSARNVGIEDARGKYLMFVDADDIIVPTCLEKMVRAIETYGTDLVLCGYERFRGDWTEAHPFSQYSVTLMQSLPEFLMVYTEARTNLFGVSIWGKLYRADIIRRNGIRFDPEISYEEDCNFNMDYLPHIRTAAALSEKLYRYRQSDTSLSKAYRKGTYRFLIHGFRRRRELLEKNGMGELVPKLESILLLVTKAMCMKLVSAPLSRSERLEEYRTIVSFPEARAAAAYAERPKSRFTRWVAFAVRRRSPKLLDLVMRTWQCADRAMDLRNSLAYKLRRRLHGK